MGCLAPCSHSHPRIIPQGTPNAEIKTRRNEVLNLSVWGFDIIRGRSVIDVLKVSGLTTDAVVMGLVAAPPP